MESSRFWTSDFFCPVISKGGFTIFALVISKPDVLGDADCSKSKGLLAAAAAAAAAAGVGYVSRGGKLLFKIKIL